MTVNQFSLALVTGATSGIGTALSRLLARKGINLILTGRNEAQLNALSIELGSLVAIQTIAADLSTIEDRHNIVRMIRKETPDLIINNAGFGLYGKAINHEVSEQLDIVDVNVTALLEFTLEGAKALKEKKKQGVILNVSSTAGFYTFPYMAVYTASKAFVNNVSQALDMEMQKSGIRILAACPGMVATNFSKRAGGKEETIPGGIVMTPEYAAEEIWSQIIRRDPLYLFSRFYRWVTRYLVPLMPRAWVLNIVKNNINSRTTK